jgi:hypothetical protein
MGTNVDAFAHIPCALHIEDVYRVLSEHPPRSEEDGQFAPEALDDLVASRAGVAFDVILTWDLFSYLEGATVQGLMARLTRRCQPGTLLFALAFMGAEIPARPGICRIGEGARLRIDPGTTERMRNPRPSPGMLERMMPGFRLQHSFLSQVGVQEYLFGFS